MSTGTINKDATIVLNGVSFSHDDLFRVVDSFYRQIQYDPLLSVPFRSVADWPEHIDRLTHFWWIRFGGKPYLFNHYSPDAKHFFAGFNRELLTRWLMIFHQTLDRQLNSEQAALWKRISESMGESLMIKNETYRRHYEQNIGTIGSSEGDSDS